MTGQKKAIWIVGSIALLFMGIMIIPKSMKKYTGLIYKKSHGAINFDRLGPEIVKKKNEEIPEYGYHYQKDC